MPNRPQRQATTRLPVFSPTRFSLAGWFIAQANMGLAQKLQQLAESMGLSPAQVLRLVSITSQTTPSPPTTEAPPSWTLGSAPSWMIELAGMGHLSSAEWPVDLPNNNPLSAPTIDEGSATPATPPSQNNVGTAGAAVRAKPVAQESSAATSDGQTKSLPPGRRFAIYDREGFQSNAENPGLEVASNQIVSQALELWRNGASSSEVLAFLSEQRNGLDPRIGGTTGHAGWFRTTTFGKWRDKPYEFAETGIRGKYEATYWERAHSFLSRRNTPDKLAQADLAKMAEFHALSAKMENTKTVGELTRLLNQSFIGFPGPWFSPEAELGGVLGRELVKDEKLSIKDKLNVVKYLLKKITTNLHHPSENIHEHDYFFTTKTSGQSIKLTRLGYSFYTGSLAWLHTNPTSMLKVMQEIVPQLTQKILDPSTSSAESLEVLADLHWHLAHAMPYERGSALIADWYIDSLARAKGIELSGWGRGISPDLEALTLPREIFIERYPSLFVRPPVLPATPPQVPPLG